MQVYNFQSSCKNQKEYKAYLRCFPAADGHCEVNDQTGGRGQLSIRAACCFPYFSVISTLIFRKFTSYIIFSYFYCTIHLILLLFQNGAFMTDGRFYQIEPLTDHLYQRTALRETGHHVITRRRVNSLMKERIKSVPVKGIILGCMEKTK